MHDLQALLEGGKHVATHVSQLRTVKDTFQQTFHDIDRCFSSSARSQASPRSAKPCRKTFSCRCDAMHSKGKGSTLALSQDSVEEGVKELYGVAAAASVPRFAQGRRLSREALLDALFGALPKRRHPGGSMPWMMFRAPVRGGPFSSSFCQDDEAAASGQQLDVLRQGFAERGEAWLRTELEKHNVRERHGVAAAASIVRGATNRAS